jgi:plasmid stabilization system protein ParE
MCRSQRHVPQGLFKMAAEAMAGIADGRARHCVQTVCLPNGAIQMPRGHKSAYTDKQKRRAEHIEEGYEDRGVSEGEAERRAWATVNKETGGGRRSGSGVGKVNEHRSLTQRWQVGWQGCGLPSGGKAFGRGEEGRGDTEAADAIHKETRSKALSR